MRRLRHVSIHNLHEVARQVAQLVCKPGSLAPESRLSHSAASQWVLLVRRDWGWQKLRALLRRNMTLLCPRLGVIVGLRVKFRLMVASPHCLLDLVLSLSWGLWSELSFAGPLDNDKSGNSFRLMFHSFTWIVQGLVCFYWSYSVPRVHSQPTGLCPSPILENLNSSLSNPTSSPWPPLPASRTLIRQVLKALSLFSVTLNYSPFLSLSLSVLGWVFLS